MQRVLIVGAGGLGGIMAAELAPHAEVTVVSTNGDIRAAIASNGLRTTDRGDAKVVHVRVVATPPAGATWPVIILATQPPQVEAAARAAASALTGDGNMLVVQNGLCEDRVGAIVGNHRVIGGIVAWGATMTAPGCYLRTARGGFTLGRLSGPPDAALTDLATLLGHAFPVRITHNLRGARFSKLALNAAISSLGTIAGERLGNLVANRRYRRLALEIMTEAVQVAHADGVRLEKVAGTLDLDWIALTDAERAAAHGSPALATKHALLCAVGLRYRNMRSSMLAAIERGRIPAVDFLNGEIVSRGVRLHVPTPVNARVVETVWCIARGELRSSRATLDAIASPAA